MKNRTLSLLFILLLAGGSELVAQQSSPILHDTLLNREDRREHREGREAWMREMHRAAPGVDVDIVSDAIRRSQRMARYAKGIVAASGKRLQFGAGWRGSWEERGSRNQAGRTWAPAVDTVTSHLYVVADGGQLWRGSIDGGEWVSPNDQITFKGSKMLEAIREGENLRLVVVTSQRAYVSESGGTEWRESGGLDNIQRWGGFQRVVMSEGENRTIYAIGQEWDYSSENWGAHGVLYRSTDLGETFDTVTRFEQRSWYDVAAIPGSDEAYVIMDGILGVVGPSGPVETRHQTIELENGREGLTRLNLRAGSPDILVLYVARDKEYEIQISSDSGRSWTRTGEAPSYLFSRNAFAIDPHDPAFLVIGGIDAFSSPDAGFTWEKVNGWGEYYRNPGTKLHADLPFFRFVDLPGGVRSLLVSTDGGIYRSDNRLASVQNLSLTGLGNSQYYSVYTARVDTNRIFAGSQDQGFQRSDVTSEGLVDFSQTISGDYGWIVSGDGGRSLWTNYPGFTMFYPDALKEGLEGGKTINIPTEGHLWIPPLAVDPDEPNVVWLAGGGTDEHPGARLLRIEHSSGAGMLPITYHPTDFSEGEEENNVNITALATSPVDPDLWYLVNSAGTLWVSEDRGENWEVGSEFKAPDGVYLYGSVLLPSKSNDSTIYVAGSGYSSPGVWVSHDRGATFDSMNVGLPPTLVYDLDISADGSLLFAATRVGPYVYLADSGKWYDASQGEAPEQTWWSVDYVEEIGVARFGTYGRGIWDLRMEKLFPGNVHRGTTGSIPMLSLVVEGIGGEQEVVVKSSAPGRGRVEIYDQVGRLVAILHDGVIASGETRFYWDGRATDGGLLPRGEYFCMVLLGGSVAFDRTGL